MSGHTPGPWSVIYADNEIHTSICGPVSATFNFDNAIMRTEAEANARLIATAPELLTALKEAVIVIYSLHGHVGWDLYQSSPEMKLITSAIDKAEGRL